MGGRVHGPGEGTGELVYEQPGNEVDGSVTRGGFQVSRKGEQKGSKGEQKRNVMYITVPNSKSRNIPEVVFVRRWAVGILGIWREGVGWVKGGANGVSSQAT